MQVPDFQHFAVLIARFFGQLIGGVREFMGLAVRFFFLQIGRLLRSSEGG